MMPFGFSLGVLQQQATNVFVYDTFTDADNTLLENHTPDIDSVGTGWHDFASDLIHIISNQATIATTGSFAVSYFIDTGTTVAVVEADFVGGSDGNAPGLWIRGDRSPLTGYFCGISNSQTSDPILRVFRYNGSFNVEASVTMTGEGGISGVAFHLKVEDTGSNVKVTCTINGSDYTCNFNTTTYNAQTEVGIRLAGGTVDTTVDNFKAYS